MQRPEDHDAGEPSDDRQPTEPNLRDYLLTAGYAGEHDEFDDAMRHIKENGGAWFTPRAFAFED
jgi:hypothetical protein